MNNDYEALKRFVETGKINKVSGSYALYAEVEVGDVLRIDTYNVRLRVTGKRLHDPGYECIDCIFLDDWCPINFEWLKYKKGDSTTFPRSYLDDYVQFLVHD